MSERMDLADVLREYGVPLVTLNVTADQQNCLALREKLLAIRNASQGKEQGYLEVECTFYIDVHDIDRYLAGARCWSRSRSAAAGPAPPRTG